MKRTTWMILTVFVAAIALAGCPSDEKNDKKDTGPAGKEDTAVADTTAEDTGGIEDDTSTTEDDTSTTQDDTSTGQDTSMDEDTSADQDTSTPQDTSMQNDTSVQADTTMADSGTMADFKEVNCSGASPAKTVELLGSNKFDPSSVTINKGDVVKWDWKSNTHTVTSGANCMPDGNFSSGNAPQNAGTTYCLQFNKTGTFQYHCVPHCNFGMKGSVTVQ
mgnify:CR=1 FL=1